MAEIEGDSSFESAVQFAMIGPDSSVIEFAHASATAVRSLPPCGRGGTERAAPNKTKFVQTLALTHETTMALQLRPNCEYCDKDLPPNSIEARICSYECTFCADCAENRLQNVCPNCGGGFVPRPIRPAKEWRHGLSVAKRPPSDKRVHLSYSLDDIAELSARIRDIPPEDR